MRDANTQTVQAVYGNLSHELFFYSASPVCLNKELEAFAYSVSHDLRAPIRHIAGFTELSQKHVDPVLDDKSRRHIRNVLDSANRMGSLVDDLLAFSRIGRAETQETTINLEQLVKSVVSEIVPGSIKKNLKI